MGSNDQPTGNPDIGTQNVKTPIAIPSVCLLFVVSTIAWGAEPVSEANSRERKDPRGWFTLAQTDTDGLLFGLQERLASAIVPSRRESNSWLGTKEGAIAETTIEVDGTEEGEVFVGFFEKPQWWLDEPKQVRRFTGPGEYLTKDLLPGEYYVGAMLVTASKKRVFGVERDWPNPTKLSKERPADLHIKISDEFEHRPFGVTHFCEQGFLGEWDKVDPSHLVTVQTVDSDGNPIPFCRVTFSERRRDDTDKIHWFHDVGTDSKGYAYLDKVDGKFSISAQRFDFLPKHFAARYQRKRDSTIYDAKERPYIKFVIDDYPAGNGTVTGRVHDQHGKPLKEFYITLTRWAYGEARTNDDALSHAMNVPVTDADGRFSINNLPVGSYTVGIRHFDYVTHVWSFNNAQFDITEELLEPTIDIEVEAKELFFSNVVDQDVRPLKSGYWSVPGVGTYAFEDGLVRVALSRAEKGNLTASDGRIEVRTDAGDKVEVRIDELSKDPEKPSLLVIDVANGTDSNDEVVATPDMDASPKESVKSEEPNDVVPDFALLDCNGNTIRLSNFKNKPVLLNFFATWCGPCQLELPKLAEVQEKHDKTGLVVLAISFEEDREVVESFARRHEFPFEIALDVDGDASSQFYDKGESRPVPLTILLDRAHRIVFRQDGFSDEKHTELLDALPDALD